MDRFSSYLHRADLDLDRPSNIPSRGNRQRPFNIPSNSQTSFNQDGISSYRAELVRLSNRSMSNSQHPRQQPQAAEPKQSPFPPPDPAPAPTPAKEFLIITYKERHVLVAKSPTFAELKQAAAEIFDINLDDLHHLYAFVRYRPGAAEPALELEIHESVYASLKDRVHVFFAHRERELERRDGEAGRRRQEGVLTGRDGSSGCGNSLNGTGQHAASHSGRRQQVFGGGHSNLNGAVNHNFGSQFPSSSRPWWSTAVELGSHLNCGTCRQNTASRSGAQGQQQPGHGSDSNVNGVGRGNNPQPEVSSSSRSTFIASVEVNTSYSLTPNQKELKAQVSRELWLVLGCQCGYWKWEDYPEVLSYKRSWEASWGRTL